MRGGTRLAGRLPAWIARVRQGAGPAPRAWLGAALFVLSALVTYQVISSVGRLTASAAAPVSAPAPALPDAVSIEVDDVASGGDGIPSGVDGVPAGPREVARLADPAEETRPGGDWIPAAGPGDPPGGTPQERMVDPQEEEEDAPPLHVITGRIAPGGSLAASLTEEGVPAAAVHELARALRPLFDFRRAQPQDFFALIRNEDGGIRSFEFQSGRRTVYRLERGADGALHARVDTLPAERRVVQLSGVVETSLFDSVIALGESGEVVNSFADIFVWDFDFSSETRPGDEFRMVVEKFYDRAGFLSYGSILAARYVTEDRELTAVYFDDEGGYADYYSPDGNSVRRTFLRAPVKYTRISSRYSKSRLHPILKVRRPHEGIDYAAPQGTPVWAVADGKVIFKGWSGGLGRLVKIRHHNGYVSYYGHLDRYPPGLAVGRQVRQKDVIGYVGSTGLATAPHLDYRLRRDGRFVDPLKVRFPSGKPVPVKARARFERVRDDLLAELDAASPPLVLEVGM